MLLILSWKGCIQCVLWLTVAEAILYHYKLYCTITCCSASVVALACLSLFLVMAYCIVTLLPVMCVVKILAALVLGEITFDYLV